MRHFLGFRRLRDNRFQTRLGVDLMLLDGGAVRTNLSFAVLPTQKATKLTDILLAIEANLPRCPVVMA